MSVAIQLEIVGQRPAVEDNEGATDEEEKDCD
jgi:hypothetical protein